MKTYGKEVKSKAAILDEPVSGFQPSLRNLSPTKRRFIAQVKALRDQKATILGLSPENEALLDGHSRFNKTDCRYWLNKLETLEPERLNLLDNAVELAIANAMYDVLNGTSIQHLWDLRKAIKGVNHE